MEQVDLTKRRTSTWADPEEAAANTPTDESSDNGKTETGSNTAETTSIDVARRKKGTGGPLSGHTSTNKKPKHRLHTRQRKSRVSNELPKTNTSDSNNTPSVDGTNRK